MINSVVDRVDASGNLSSTDVDEISQIKSGIDEDINQDRLSALERIAAPQLGKFLRKPLLYRAILDGRAVGEWHVTVGNPMNPMAMIGNLCLDDVSVKFSETLGIDDFPDEVSFTVTLSHGRIRAKQDFESIFNLGNGAMTFNELAPPSSATDSYGPETTDALNSALGEGVALSGELVDAGNKLPDGQTDLGKQSSTSINGAVNSSGSDLAAEQERIQRLESIANASRSRVTSMYGANFGNSPILTDYFKDGKIKG